MGLVFEEEALALFLRKRSSFVKLDFPWLMKAVGISLLLWRLLIKERDTDCLKMTKLVTLLQSANGPHQLKENALKLCLESSQALVKINASCFRPMKAKRVGYGVWSNESNWVIKISS